MTPDRALKAAIMDDAPAAATAAVNKSRAPKARSSKSRTARARGGRPIWVMGIVTRTLMYTPEGQALLQQSAEHLAKVIGPVIADAQKDVVVDAGMQVDAVEATTAVQSGAETVRADASDRPAVRSMPGSQDAVRRLELPQIAPSE